MIYEGHKIADSYDEQHYVEPLSPVSLTTYIAE